jgi:hypothetical protein
MNNPYRYLFDTKREAIKVKISNTFYSTQLILALKDFTKVNDNDYKMLTMMYEDMISQEFEGNNEN